MKDSEWRLQISDKGEVTDLDEIWQANVKCHAHDNKQLKIETGNRIPIWRTSVFTNRKQK